MNANRVDENGNPHFNLKLDEDKFITTSPITAKQSQLWTHMLDFRQDGKTKIKNIRRKYRNILSPELSLKKIINPGK